MHPFAIAPASRFELPQSVAEFSPRCRNSPGPCEDSAQRGNSWGRKHSSSRRARHATAENGIWSAPLAESRSRFFCSAEFEQDRQERESHVSCRAAPAKSCASPARLGSRSTNQQGRQSDRVRPEMEPLPEQSAQKGQDGSGTRSCTRLIAGRISFAPRFLTGLASPPANLESFQIH